VTSTIRRLLGDPRVPRRKKAPLEQGGDHVEFNATDLVAEQRDRHRCFGLAAGGGR
jgi:hypothetical protein